MKQSSVAAESKRALLSTKSNSPVKAHVPRKSHTVEGRVQFIQVYEEIFKLILDLNASNFASHVDFKYPKVAAVRIWGEREGDTACVKNTLNWQTLTKICPLKMETVEQAATP